VFEVSGPFFFGAAEKFRVTLVRGPAGAQVLIVRMRSVPVIDSTGLHVLTELIRRTRKEGTLVILSDVHAQPMIGDGQRAALDEIGDDNIHGNIDDALNRARVHLNIPTIDRTGLRDPHGEARDAGDAARPGRGRRLSSERPAEDAGAAHAAGAGRATEW